MVPRMARRPGWPCAVLLVTGVMALMLGGLAMYARARRARPRAFAGRATGALRSGRGCSTSRRADRGARDRGHPALAARRPILEAAVGDVVADPRSRPSSTPARSCCTMPSSVTAAWPCRSTARGRRSGSASRRWRCPAPGASSGPRSPPAPPPRPPRSREDPVFSLGGGKLETALVDAAPHAQRLSALAPLAFAAGILLLGLAAWRAPTRRLGFRRGALGIALASGAIVAASSIARAVVLSTFDTSHGDAVVGTIWSAFLADLRLWALATGAVA